MRIGAVQKRMREIAMQRSIPELAALADELSRRPPRGRAPVKSAHCDDQMRMSIRSFHMTHPDASQVEIAKAFNVNPGRVSEALRGKRQ